MLKMAQGMVEVLRERYPNLIVIHQFWPMPEQGVVAWAKEMYGEAGFRPQKGSIPDRLIEAEAYARYYADMTVRVLDGSILAEFDYDPDLYYVLDEAWHYPAILRYTNNATLSEGDRMYAWVFYYQRVYEQGFPIYIGIYDDNSRYQETMPILRRANHPVTGAVTHLAGDPRLGRHKVINGETLAEIIGAARQWFSESVDAELSDFIEKTKGERVPRTVQDMLTIVLKEVGECVDSDGDVVAWQNGRIHWFYGVEATDWAYIRRMSVVNAVKLLFYGLRQSREKYGYSAPLDMSRHIGQFATYWGYKATDTADRIEGNDIVAAKSGQVWAIKSGNKMWVATVGTPVRGVVPVSLRSKDGKAKEEGGAPEAWGLAELDLVAWAMFRVDGKASKKEDADD
jgi:hypothetical protein